MATIRCRPDEPFSAFPSWFMRITCDRRGKDRVISETHASAAQRDMPIRETVKRMRHDGCGGRAGKVELMTGIAIEAHFVGRKRTTIMEVARDALKIETPRLGTHDQRRIAAALERSGWKRGEHTEIGPRKTPQIRYKYRCGLPFTPCSPKRDLVAARVG